MTECTFPIESAKQSAVLMAFPHEDTDWNYDLKGALSVFVRVASSIAYGQPLIIVCDNAAKTKELFCDIRNISFVEIPTNDTWARDFGPITLCKDGKRYFLDFTFNGWGGKFESSLDDKVTAKLVECGYLWGEYEKVDCILEGGSIESDGAGTILTTSKCLLNQNRNPQMNKEQIEGFLKDKLCIERILWLDYGELEGDDTDAHIDTLARFIDKETIAYVSCDDEDDPHYEELKRMRMQLESFKTLKGEPYKLIALPMPSAKYKDKRRLPATYANFLVTNRSLILPTYRDKKDAEAKEIFKSLFPDKEIVPIDSLKLIEQGGSIHCLTMQIPACTL